MSIASAIAGHRLFEFCGVSDAGGRNCVMYAVHSNRFRPLLWQLLDLHREHNAQAEAHNEPPDTSFFAPDHDGQSVLTHAILAGSHLCVRDLVAYLVDCHEHKLVVAAAKAKEAAAAAAAAEAAAAAAAAAAAGVREGNDEDAATEEADDNDAYSGSDTDVGEMETTEAEEGGGGDFEDSFAPTPTKIGALSRDAVARLRAAPPMRRLGLNSRGSDSNSTNGRPGSGSSATRNNNNNNNNNNNGGGGFGSSRTVSIAAGAGGGRLLSGMLVVRMDSSTTVGSSILGHGGGGGGGPKLPVVVQVHSGVLGSYVPPELTESLHFLQHAVGSMKPVQAISVVNTLLRLGYESEAVLPSVRYTVSKVLSNRACISHLVLSARVGSVGGDDGATGDNAAGSGGGGGGGGGGSSARGAAAIDGGGGGGGGL